MRDVALSISGIMLLRFARSPSSVFLAFGSSALPLPPLRSTGKTAILRFLGALWPCRYGAICRPAVLGRDGILFVPQKPYITLGSLRAQIVYPKRVEEATGALWAARTRKAQAHTCVGKRATGKQCARTSSKHMQKTRHARTHLWGWSDSRVTDSAYALE